MIVITDIRRLAPSDVHWRLPRPGLTHRTQGLQRRRPARHDHRSLSRTSSTPFGHREPTVENIDGADFAGITFVTKSGTLSTPAALDELVVSIDRVPYDVRQGPCLSSV